MNQNQTDVLIIGSGPIGLTLAMDLASRGVAVTVLEMRHHAEPPSVKCNHIAARSMEIFRRLGVAAKIRAAGLPDDYANDVSYRTTATGTELARILIPSRLGRLRGDPGPDTKWPTMEPPHRVNQIYLEPILAEHAAAMPGVKLLNRMEVIAFAQDADGTTLQARNLDTDEISHFSARYLIGCDGGRSMVRKGIGAVLIGDAVVQRVQSTFIKAPSLLGLFQQAPAWATFSLNPRRCGNMYAIDGKERWLIHNYLQDGEPDFESVDRDRCIRDILGVDDTFEYEMISKEDWFGRRLVADRFRDRRVFICGDAAHLWVPYAGYGMNAGIADAANLAWLLGAHLNGWADERVLDAYSDERKPITEQVSRFAMNHAHAMASQRNTVPADIEAAGAAGDAIRAEIGRQAYDLNVQQYSCAGLNFGYFYDASPLIAYDGEAPPEYSMGSFTPSTVPGCRTPHFKLPDGRSLYDAMGAGYTLLRFDPAIDIAPLLAAAKARGVPLDVLDIDAKKHSTPIPDSYRHALLLARPDQHVAWRGDTLPSDPLALIDLIRGAGAQTTASASAAPVAIS
jgi:2-polyprenyl-6-methoxyphenol hydroxylase-like FAD-dependent oxidoreductase